MSMNVPLRFCCSKTRSVVTEDLQAAGKADAVEEQNGISLAVAGGPGTIPDNLSDPESYQL